MPDYYNETVDLAIDGKVPWTDLDEDNLRRFIVALADQAGCYLSETDRIADVLGVERMPQR